MRVAESIPSACSSCYGQYPSRRHVDFESSWDGPVIEGGIMTEGGLVQTNLPVAIDELVICEDCLAAGAKLLGMDYKSAEKIQHLTEQLQAAQEKIVGMEVYTAQMEKALASKPQRQRVAA